MQFNPKLHHPEIPQSAKKSVKIAIKQHQNLHILYFSLCLFSTDFRVLPGQESDVS